MSHLTNIDSEIDRFLAQKAQEPVRRGRLIFALDATMSRQRTWDTACQLQAGIFNEVARLGALDVMLLYYRGPAGTPEGECKASRWYDSAAYLTKAMAAIDCRAGHTQLRRVLQHCCKEASQTKVNAVVFVGDACEEEWDDLAQPAAELGRLKTPVFLFQEGRNPEVEQIFREIARLSGGVYGRFDTGAARQLSELLKAVALYAVGGVAALEGRKDNASVLLLGQLK